MNNNPWFKFYSGDFLRDLDLKFDEFTETEISCWLVLLCYAALSDEPGVISHLTEEKLLKKARVKDTLGGAGIFKKFKNLGMITDDNGVITIQRWEKRQEKSMTPYERVKKYREKKRMITDDNGSDNVVEESRRDKKRIEEIILPDWLNKNAWNAWVKYRKEIGKTLKPSTIHFQLKFLGKYIPDHTQIIRNSITNGWTGLFPLKEKGNSYDRRVRQAEESRERSASVKDNQALRTLNEQSKQLSEKMKV